MTKRATTQRMVSTGRAAGRTGWCVRTIRRYAEKGAIPGAVRIGAGQWRIPLAWIEAVEKAARAA